MRLFVAVDLDPALRRRVADLIGRARSAAGDRHRLAWVAADRLHLTLHFLGEVAPEAAARAASVLEAPYRTGPFDLGLGGFGRFPARGRPRVIWIGVTRGGDGLAALASEAGARLAAAGFAIAHEPFVAHLTLARARGPLPSSTLRQIEALGAREVGRTRVDRVTLYESRPGPSGPTYVALASGPCME